MSDYTTNASVNLNVNGKDAEETLSRLKQRASDYRDAIAKAAKEGNKTELNKLRKDLKATEKQIKSVQSATMNVADVLRRLDSATPKELKSTLKQLNKELNNMERGSKAWDEQTEKIRRVKKELDSVNSTLATQRTRWQKLGDWVNKWQALLLGSVASLAGVVSAGKHAVQSYADMDSALANTQKFTGMSREEVELLNEELKKMDTRTAREGLNELAQAAGRLGKNSVEDVLGFVRAGDIIGVAMDELGKDAPQIISQLARIFNLESEMGTEKAMLSVGSAINTLSQNCAASAPNLVDFAGRLGAIASSTNMSMDEMLAFGALLDDQKVSIEKSSTAIQGVITKMYAEPAEFARKAGMDADAFTEALKRSSTEGVLMFVEALAQMDQMEQAATLKALGTAGAGVVQTFQTLAGKVDLLKTQMQTSKSAFDEATSATEEFNVQNNTVQAGLDKAKKKLHELVVELGEKFAPIMKHAISSTALILEIISAAFAFIDKYKGEIVAVTASILAYNIAVDASAIKTKALAAAQGIAKAATAAWTVVTQAAAVVTALLTGRLHKAKIEFMIFSGLLKASPIGLLVAGITAVVGGLALWANRTKEVSSLQKAVNDATKKANTSIAEEKASIEALVFVAENERISMGKRLEAMNKLNSIVPGYNARIDETTGKYTASKKALDDYLLSLEKKIRYEANEAKLRELIGTHEAALNKRDDLEITLENERKNLPQTPIYTNGHAATGASPIELFELSAEARRKALDAEVAQAENDVDEFKKRMNERLEKGTISPGIRNLLDSENSPNDDTGSSFNDDTEVHEDRFKAEKEWREREEALNRIAYATGQKSYEDYTKRMNEISVDFYNKQLTHSDLSENERLSIQAQYHEAVKKQNESYISFTLDEERNAYIERLAQAKQYFIDGKYSNSTYNEEIERIEAEHLRKMVALTREGTKERAEAEKALSDFDYQAKLKKQQDTEKIQQQLKKDYFGDNATERQQSYDSDLANLDIVYNAELQAAQGNAEERLRIEEAYEQAKLALKKKYGLLSVDENRNALEKANAELVEWLKSDAGKAVTQSFDTVMSGMGAIFSQVSSLVQAELEIQTAAIEKRYDKEISLAEGNTYKVNKLEKKKQAEIAKAKNEANKKQFAMQVIQAVAQTAQNAIAAYGSAAAIPMVGYILAPIAASMAVAAGMLQIAAIKKQQQASASQGYASGGFTPQGGKYEPAGIVHKGEWVASQELLASPVARPMIEALDYAQRTNTIGSLRADDVSRSITAPIMLANSQASPQVVVQQVPADNGNSLSTLHTELSASIARLNERLNEPFVTVNTVTGDTGIKKAQDEYEKLMRNKTPKSKRKSI